MSAVPTDKAGRPGHDEKRLERAVKHVSNFWLPPNPALLHKIRTGLVEGRYELGIDFLLDDLQKDIGLYSYCLKELSELLKARKTGERPANPIALFEEAGFDRIQQLLNQEPARMSQHGPHQLGKPQMRQLEASLICASTAETLAESVDLNPRLAYLGGLLRQFGLLLISWNYPSLYQRALQSRDKSKDLDALLSEMLGFSPGLLTVRLMAEWKLSSELEAAVLDREPEKDASLHTLTGICRTGAALARANQPDLYPSAEHDWEHARSRMEEILGSDALAQVAERVKEYCTEYAAAFPELFAAEPVLNPPEKIRMHAVKKLLRHNPAGERCAPLLRKRLQEFYHQRAVTGDPQQVLSFLIKEVFPQTGFCGAAVYTPEIERAQLIQRLKIGTIMLHPATSCPLEQKRKEEDVVTTACYCSVPINSRGLKDISYIVGRLENERNKVIGVLYVELPTGLYDAEEASPLVAFKAFRQALQDALTG